MYAKYINIFRPLEEDIWWIWINCGPPIVVKKNLSEIVETFPKSKKKLCIIL